MEDLLDLLLASITVDVHFQHASLGILEEQRTQVHQNSKTNNVAAGDMEGNTGEKKSKAACLIKMAAKTRRDMECLESRGSKNSPVSWGLPPYSSSNAARTPTTRSMLHRSGTQRPQIRGRTSSNQETLLPRKIYRGDEREGMVDQKGEKKIAFLLKIT